jgi:hypothetical protein
VRGIRLGEVEDVILDEEGARVLGLDVLCGDGSNRFLPFSTARLNGVTIETDSTLTLLDRRELDFYRRHGRSLASVPEVAEAIVRPDGALVVQLSARC